MTPGVSASYFDGRTARAHAVTLTVEGGELVIAGAEITRRIPMGELQVSEALGRAPRRVTLADGTFCEVRDNAGLAALLAAAGRGARPIERMQSSWTWALVSIVVAGLVFASAYHWGVPWLAGVAAEHVGAPVTDKLSEDTFGFLEKAYLKPTKVPAERRASIVAAFDALRAPEGDKVAHRIEFRDAEFGANALALPSGLILVTDDLVKLTEDDREIAAVLAHEIGHVKERHGIRQALQASIIGVVLTWWLGDISSALASIPAALLDAKYSRDFERSADDYAARMLRANGLSPALLASMLEKLEADAAKPRGTKDAEPAATKGDAPAPQPKAQTPADAKEKRTGRQSPLEYLSSHPATAERLARLRAM